MSTRSWISIQRPDGRVRAIYCHNDGYLDYNGDILFHHYTEAKDVNKLISCGDMSSLGQTLYECDFYKDWPDRYEPPCPMMFKSVQELVDEFNQSGADYLYLFRDGYWQYIKYNEYVNEFRDLGEVFGYQ